MTTTGIETSAMDSPPVVSPDEWQTARDELLDKEKAATRHRDELAAARRRLPWVELGKEYRFAGPNGDLTLADLFDGRSQLIVYRAFFEPGVEKWPDGGCSGGAMFIDNMGHVAHLNERDTTFVLVSPAPPHRSNGRAADAIGNVWSLLDITPLGRQEEWEDSPDGYPQGPPYTWWKLHDDYERADES